MTTEYRKADEVKVIAERLISLFHPHLHGVRIEYVFLSEPPKRLGRPLAGRARKVAGLNAYLATPGCEGEPEPFFVMEITWPIWLSYTIEKKIALVDHELKHFDLDEETGQLTIRPHDVEEHICIVERHGAWSEDLVMLIEVLSNGDVGLLDESFEALTHEAQKEAEGSLAVIDLRRSANRRDQQACA